MRKKLVAIVCAFALWIFLVPIFGAASGYLNGLVAGSLSDVLQLAFVFISSLIVLVAPAVLGYLAYRKLMAKEKTITNIQGN